MWRLICNPRGYHSFFRSLQIHVFGHMNTNSLSQFISDNFEISSKVFLAPFTTKNIQNTRMIAREYDLAQVEEVVRIVKLCDICVVLKLISKQPYVQTTVRCNRICTRRERKHLLISKTVGMLFTFIIYLLDILEAKLFGVKSNNIKLYFSLYYVICKKVSCENLAGLLW